MHFSRSIAAYAASISSALAAAAGLALMRFTDRKGPAAVAACPLLAIPVLLWVGLAEPASGLLLTLTVLGTMLIVGGHYGVHSIASIYYPSAIRASGGGWATSVAKLGGIAGPSIGSLLLTSGMPANRTYAYMTVCPAVLAACAVGIALVLRRSAPLTLSTPGVPLAAPES
jgi:AAHS family 4-hydroxybenzoate transporter-like MFS transporter